MRAGPIRRPGGLRIHPLAVGESVRVGRVESFRRVGIYPRPVPSTRVQSIETLENKWFFASPEDGKSG
jgi:hypothetical protein